MQIKNLLLGISFIICLIIIITWTFSVPEKPPQAPIQTPPHALSTSSGDTTITSTLPAITIKNITLREAEKNKDYELVVTAQESTFHHIDDTVECCHVTCKIIHRGVTIAHVFAEKSLLDRLTKRVVFAGPVKGCLKELGLEGYDICYNFSNQTVTTDKTITYTHPQFSFVAQKSFVDINTQKIKMSHGVRSEFFMLRDTPRRR